MTISTARQRPLFLSLALCCWFGSLGQASGAVAGGDADDRFSPPPICGDSSFAAVSQILVQPDGRVLVAGPFRSLGDRARWGIARLFQDGSLDPSFEMDGAPGPTVDVDVFGFALDSRLRVLVAGFANTLDQGKKPRFWRLGSDGRWDSGFRTGFAEVSTCLALESGGVIAAGNFTAYDGQPRGGLAWLKEDGSLDPGIHPDFRVSPSPSAPVPGVRALTVDSQGRIWVAGDFESAGGRPGIGVARFTRSGELDQTFKSPFGVFSNVRCLLPLPDRGLLVGGTLNLPDGAQEFLVRLSESGSLDGTFRVIARQFQSSARALKMDSAGRVLVAALAAPSFLPKAQRLHRLVLSGGFDPSFALSPSPAMDSIIGSIDLSPQGEVYAAGQFASYDRLCSQSLIRFHADALGDGPPFVSGAAEVLTVRQGSTVVLRASVDETASKSPLQWWHQGRLVPGQNQARLTLGSVEISDEGNWFLVASNSFGVVTQHVATVLVRPTSPGSVELPLALAESAQAAVGLPGGGALVANHSLTRIDSRGALDPTFEVSVLTNGISAVVPVGDGGILIAGGFTKVNGSSAPRIARLTGLGGLVNSFDVRAGFSSGAVFALAAIGEGGCYAAGEFSNYQGVTRKRIVKIQSDGLLDLSFDPRGGPNGPVRSLCLQADGKLLIGGDFISVAGGGHPHLARLLPTGEIDESFNAGDDFNGGVASILLQPGGQILIAGAFARVAGQAKRFLARLNPDGSLDDSFGAGSDPNAALSGMVLDPLGNILVAGPGLTSIGSVVSRGLARLFPDGTADVGFDPGQGPTGDVGPLSLAWVGEDRILLAGRFQQMDGTPSRNLALLKGAQSFPSEPAILSPLEDVAVYPGRPVALGAGASGSVLRYQWFRNSAALRSETNRFLQRAQAGAQDEGSYLVTIHQGAVVLTNGPATLRLLPAPPELLSSIALTRRVPQGETVKLSVNVSGVAPLAYQWSWNGQELRGETGSVLFLPDMSIAESGCYRVRVFCPSGELVGPPSHLWVQKPVDVNESLDTPGWKWLAGVAPWIAREATWARNGSAASCEPEEGQGGEPAWLETRVVGPGTVTAKFSLLLPQSLGFLERPIGGSIQSQVSALFQDRYDVPVGEHVVRWTLHTPLQECNQFGRSDDACHEPFSFLLDNVAFTPSKPTLPSILDGPFDAAIRVGEGKRLFVHVQSQTPVSYQWWKDGRILPTATRSTLPLPYPGEDLGGSYRVQVSNRVGSVDSAVATVTEFEAVPPKLSQPRWVAPGRVAITVSLDGGQPFVLERSMDLKDWKTVRVLEPQAQPLTLELETAELHQFFRLSEL